MSEGQRKQGKGGEGRPMGRGSVLGARAVEQYWMYVDKWYWGNPMPETNTLPTGGTPISG